MCVGDSVIEEREIFQWKAAQELTARSSNDTLQDRVLIIIWGCFAKGLVFRAVHTTHSKISLLFLHWELQTVISISLKVPASLVFHKLSKRKLNS